MFSNWAHGRVVVGALALAATTIVLGGCHGSSLSSIPRGATPGSTSPSTPPSTSGPLSADQVNAALHGVQAYYATLPHADLQTDLSSLAGHMVSAGDFSTAFVVPGGISATLLDGSAAVVFADRPEGLPDAVTAGSALQPSLQPRSQHAVHAHAASMSSTIPASAHEVVFFVNNSDPFAFAPARQSDFAQAFTEAGFTAVALDVSIENIIALGKSHPIDFLSIATHGTPFYNPRLDKQTAHAKQTAPQGFVFPGGSTPVPTPTPRPPNDYAWQSTTCMTPSILTALKADIAAGTISYSVALAKTYDPSQPGVNCPSVFFTFAFLAAHLKFNLGSIVDNESCHGQNPVIADKIHSDLRAADVGRYFGWSDKALETESDENDAFLIDRLLGGANPRLGKYVDQRTPPQRPFPLDAIQKQMDSETRSGPLDTASIPYTKDRAGTRFEISDFGGGSVANPVIEYGLPSIARLQVVESPAKGTLTILGNFPATNGTAQITDASGVHVLTPSVWATDHITATLPPAGAGAAGRVQVLSADGIPSNAVPLTQWHGQLVYTEDDSISHIGNTSGSGSGTIEVTYNLDVRADVHPVVMNVDATPSPQNLTFPLPQGSSTAAVTKFNGTFTTSDGLHHATFSLVAGAPGLNPAATPLPASAFAVGAIAGQPAPCNNGSPGPQGGAGNVFCPGVGFVSQDVGHCSDDSGGTICGPIPYSPRGGFGFQPGEGGLLVLTMDPASYALTVTSIPAQFISEHFGGGARPSTASMRGSFQAPLEPPTNKTPASGRRAPTP